ncbi:MAG: type 4a pilus biogenesis protein PilO [Candidatus Sumerlaeota bacterium]|nr:type 4a pilus biogenesis protein PilO [Candidatus Sumerlaeota bacterium]
MSEHDKKILQFGLFIGILLMVIVGYWWFVMVRSEIKNQLTIQKDLTAKLQAVSSQLAEIDAAEKNRAETLEKAQIIEQASSRLPSSPDAQGFLSNLVEILRKSGVVNHLVTKGQPTERAAYTEIPWSVRGVGQYFEFGAFLNMVELNPRRFMRVKSLKVTNDPNLPGYHPIEVEIGTFMFNQ